MLVGLRRRTELIAEVNGAEYKSGFSDFDFNYDCQFMIAKKVIDNLDYRLNCAWQFIQFEHYRIFIQVPPLPVAMNICWKIIQSWMGGITQDAHCSGLTREVDRTPEDGGEAAGDFKFKLLRTGQKQDFFAGINGFEEFITD